MMTSMHSVVMSCMSRIIHTNTRFQEHDACRDCALSAICAPASIGDTAIDISDSLVLKRQPIKAGETIYTQGQPFENLYALTSGSAKEIWQTKQSKPHIISFKLKGELVGQNAIALNTYPNTLVALEDGSICTLNYQRLINSAKSLPELLTKIITLLAVDASQETEVRKSLAVTTNAEEKVRAFVYNIAQRYKSRNQNYIDIKLSMNRSEIANYLGITKETLSRSLTSLQKRNLIEASGKYIHITHFNELKID